MCLTVLGLAVLPTVKLTSNEQLNPACSLDLLFKGVTLSLQVSCIPIQNVGVFWVDVNVLEEVVPHKGVVTLWVFSRKTCGAMATLRHAQAEPEPFSWGDALREMPAREPWAPALRPSPPREKLS